MQEGGDRATGLPLFYSRVSPQEPAAPGEEKSLTSSSNAAHLSVRLMMFTVPSGFTVSRWSVPSLQVARQAGWPW